MDFSGSGIFTVSIFVANIFTAQLVGHKANLP